MRISVKMGDTASENSIKSCWSKDDLEFVNERPNIKQSLSCKESLDLQDNDEPVSSAVSLVVSSARQGVIALCANVAHILREKQRLQERVTTLEKQLHALENSSSGVSSVNGSCSVHCQATDSHSLQESPISQRCGSAPANFIASGLKFLKTDCQNNSEFTQNDIVKHEQKDNNCCCSQEQGLRECRTSRHSMPETNSHMLSKACSDRKEVFIRGPRQTSTRSLNICQSFPKASFVRRKYSTISLRRVRRSTTSRQKSSSICSSLSFSSNASSNFIEEQHKHHGSGSCIVTVAEVHTPPPQHLSLKNTETEAVKLLAKALTTYINKTHCNLEKCLDSSPEVCMESPDIQTSISQPQPELCLPHPLAGCECAICLNMSADPNCHLYALSTGEGSLLPSGSKVLIEGERVGTVLYLGHEKYSSKSPRSVLHGSAETSHFSDGVLRPVGVTVKLWAPDGGDIFVPLSGVICQLDDDSDISQKDSLSNSEYEYLTIDSDDDCIFTNADDALESEDNVKVVYQREAMRKRITNEGNIPSTGYFIRSPSASSYGSDISHSLGDLSAYGLNCGDDDLEFNKEKNFRYSPPAVPSQVLKSASGSESVDIPSCDPLLNTTFIRKTADEYVDPRKEICRNKSLSLYDTSDSAISLSFSKRFQHSEESSEPSSITGTGRESPHFGDTWDSGCSVGRGRCKSDSSGHNSDVELETSRLGNTFAKSLGDALNAVLEKHKINYSEPLKNKTLHDNIILTRSHLGKRHHRRKEALPLPELCVKDKESLYNNKYHISGSIGDQSEV